MNTAFEFHAPTRVRFGAGVRHELPDILRGSRWSLLSSPSVLAHSGIQAILDAARRGGVDIGEATLISPNPRLAEVEEALTRALADETTGVLAVGGGSVLDAGKLLRSALRHGSSAWETLDDFSTVTLRTVAGPVRLVAVPTTAGTGAEVSRGAIITDGATGEKKAVRGEELVPDEAVIDPELSLSLPPRQTAESGFDILAHAIETYLSRRATPFTEILSLAAVEAAPAALLDARADGSDLRARTTLSLHAWLMGYNLAHASTCLPHRMQYPIGTATDTSHPLGLAALYPAWLSAVRRVVPDRLASLMVCFRRGIAPHLGEAETQLGDVELLEWYMEILGVRVGLVDLGLTEADVPALAHAVTGRLDLDPLDATEATLEQIYRHSLEVGV